MASWQRAATIWVLVDLDLVVTVVDGVKGGNQGKGGSGENVDVGGGGGGGGVRGRNNGDG